MFKNKILKYFLILSVGFGLVYAANDIAMSYMTAKLGKMLGENIRQFLVLKDYDEDEDEDVDADVYLANSDYHYEIPKTELLLSIRDFYRILRATMGSYDVNTKYGQAVMKLKDNQVMAAPNESDWYEFGVFKWRLSKYLESENSTKQSPIYFSKDDDGNAKDFFSLKDEEQFQVQKGRIQVHDTLLKNDLSGMFEIFMKHKNQIQGMIFKYMGVYKDLNTDSLVNNTNTVLDKYLKEIRNVFITQVMNNLNLALLTTDAEAKCKNNFATKDFWIGNQKVISKTVQIFESLNTMDETELWGTLISFLRYKEVIDLFFHEIEHEEFDSSDNDRYYAIGLAKLAFDESKIFKGIDGNQLSDLQKLTIVENILSLLAIGAIKYGENFNKQHLKKITLSALNVLNTVNDQILLNKDITLENSTLVCEQ